MRLFTKALFIIIAIATANASYAKGADTTLYYLVRQPKIAVADPPLLILMHGIGSNEKDLFSFANELPAKFLVVSARGPYSVGQDSYAWYEADFSTQDPVINKAQAEKSRTTIIEFIGQLKKKYHFNDKQVYLCGFSQGAIMAYSVGLTRPDKIKGIAVLSGRIPEEIKPKIKPGKDLENLDVFITHGTRDNRINIRYARDSRDYLLHLGIKPTYKEYNDVHTINQEMFSDFLKWLNK